MKKTKLFKRILAVALSAALMGNVLCVQAAQLPEEDAIAEDVEVENISTEDYVIEMESSTGDLEVNSFADKEVEAVTNFGDESFAVNLTGEEISLYANSRIQTVDAENETREGSVQHYGTVSDYLAETGDYKLYSLNLSAGDYLQARLTVPNNTSINYALVLYDSELNVIKMSHYIPYLNGTATLEESVGYLPISDELIYVGIFSLVGGSTAESYTLDFSITTNYASLSDVGEPNENVQEAATLSLGNAGANISGMLNSAIDNDWYSFTVIDSPKYDKIRLNLTSTSSSSTNGYRMEIYKNLTDDYFTMGLVANGTGEGELDLPVGTYYVRVMSTNTFSDFNSGELLSYNLSVVPVSRVDGIKITKYQGPAGNDSGVPYPEGSSYLLYNSQPNWINIVGMAYYTNAGGSITGAANVKLKITVVNASWMAHERPDLATTYKIAVTEEDGFFHRSVEVNDAVGLKYCRGDCYDVMNVEVSTLSAPERKENGFFFLLKKY